MSISAGNTCHDLMFILIRCNDATAAGMWQLLECHKILQDWWDVLEGKLTVWWLCVFRFLRKKYGWSFLRIFMTIILTKSTMCISRSAGQLLAMCCTMSCRYVFLYSDESVWYDSFGSGSSHGSVVKVMTGAQQTWVQLPLLPIWVISGGRKSVWPKLIPCTSKLLPP